MSTDPHSTTPLSARRESRALVEVLVLPGGTELGLEIGRALSADPGVRASSANSSSTSHAAFAFERDFVVPSVHTANWLPALHALVRTERIDFIHPAHDDVLLALAEHVGELGAGLVTSPLETCRVARSKRTTYASLDGAVPVPEVLDPDGHAELARPVFVKPDRGQGSSGARVVRSRSELERALAETTDPLVTEYLPGREFTVDCFSDRERGLLFVGGRERLRTRGGIAVRTESREDSRFAEYAERIGSRLAFHGAWFFQLRERSSDELVLLEVAPRIAGGSGLQRLRGVNLPLLALREQQRLPLDVRPGAWSVALGRALDVRVRTRLDVRHVRVALEDTLVHDGKLRSALVAQLLDAHGRGARLTLVADDVVEAQRILESHRIGALFDVVVPRDGFSAPPLAPGLGSASLTPDSHTLEVDDDAERRALLPPDAVVLDSSAATTLLEGSR